MTDDPLRRLAKRGRGLLDEDRAAQADTSSAAADDATKQRQRRLRSSISSFCRWGWWVGGFGFGAVLAIGLYQLFPASWSSGDDGGDTAMAVALLAFGFPPLALFLLRPAFGDRAVEREQSWVGGLPFALPGYFDAIASSTTEGRATLTIQFQISTPAENVETPFRSPGAVPTSTAPPDDLLRAVFRTIGAEFEAAPDPRITYKIDFGDTSVLTNAHLARWLHRAIEVLLTVHAQHPIESVKIDGFR